MYILKLIQIAQSKKLLYSLLASLLPIFIVMVLDYESLPKENKYNFLFLFAYILIFQAMYMIYFDKKEVLNLKIINKISPSFFKTNSELLNLNAVLVDLQQQHIEMANNKQFGHQLNFLIANRYNYYSQKSKMMYEDSNKVESKIKSLADEYKYNKFSWENYKAVDYLLLFVGTLLIISKVKTNSLPFESTLGNSYVIFAFLFFVTLIFYTFYEYVKYLKIKLLAKLYTFLLPFSISYLSKRKV